MPGKAKPRKATAKPRSAAKKAVANPREVANGPDEKAAARRIDERIRSLGDWRGARLAEARRLIHEADPDVVEEVKWVKPTNPWGVPVWSHAGIVCTGEVYQEYVKLTFARGASLADPAGLFNASLAAGTRRAIDLRESDRIDAPALKELFLAAVAENVRASALRK